MPVAPDDLDMFHQIVEDLISFKTHKAKQFFSCHIRGLVEQNFTGNKFLNGYGVLLQNTTYFDKFSNYTAMQPLNQVTEPQPRPRSFWIYDPIVLPTAGHENIIVLPMKIAINWGMQYIN